MAVDSYFCFKIPQEVEAKKIFNCLTDTVTFLNRFLLFPLYIFPFSFIWCGTDAESLPIATTHLEEHLKQLLMNIT